MNPDIKAQWLAALRSGDYKQGTQKLRGKDAEGNATFCCLGVLCDLAVKAGAIPEGHEPVFNDDFENFVYEETESYGLPVGVQRWAELPDESPWVDVPDPIPGSGYGSRIVSLAEANDEGTSFENIATLIERYLS